jgi:predicted Fe-Mo cluster-binding NifX family protein
MIIAVPRAGNEVVGQLANAGEFAVFHVEDGVVTGSSVVESAEARQAGPEGAGPQGPVTSGREAELVAFFRRHGVEVILTGTIGYSLQQALKSAGFTVYSGVSGDVAAAVAAFLGDDIEPAAPGNRPLHGPPWAR